MRLFTAIDLPGEVVDRLEATVRTLRPLAPIAWSRIENLHITTKFIGQWPDDRLAELTSAFAKIRTRGPIPIHVRGFGFYASAIFWAGVDAVDELKALAQDTDAACAELGIEPEKRAYSPHLTLARVKKPTNLKSLHAAVEKLGRAEFGAFSADRFHLYLSKPGPGGSVYTKLSEFPFSTQ